MAMGKRADGIIPLCDLAAREKTSVSGVVRNCSRDGWKGPTSSRDKFVNLDASRSGGITTVWTTGPVK